MTIPETLRKRYITQRYRVVGKHSAVKSCVWLGKAIRTEGKEHCYKQQFYGIPTHRCMQMTPSLGHCTQSCIFCWRATPETIGVNWEQTRPIAHGDDPEFIVESALVQHRKLIYGYGGNPKVTQTILKEALNPVHAAISLEGEPTLYENLDGLIDSLKKHGFKSIFLVTNGTRPELLSTIRNEPSQLYISLCAPDEETYLKVCKPQIPRAWDKINESLGMLNSFKCPTVLRHTLVPNKNMNNIERYAELAERSNATYLEPKGAMSVGFARQRFHYNEMASYADIQKFAKELSFHSGYNIIDEQYQSNIVLLSKLTKPINLYA